MKGLLLKDWYMMKAYCRSYLLIITVFLAVSFAGEDNMFFMFYPCVFCGMLPINLLGYDERSRWLQYTGTLPCTKAQIVSAKYLIGLFVQLAMILVTCIVQAVRMAVSGGFAMDEFIVFILTLLTVAPLSSAISLPFIFKLGVEKGRIAYYVMIGLICGASALAANLFNGTMQIDIQPNTFVYLLAAFSIGLYVFSWFLSIWFYQKREIT